MPGEYPCGICVKKGRIQMAKTAEAKGIFDERAAALIEEASKDYPESWIPEDEGDSIAGIFSGLDKGRTSFGPAWIVVLNVGGTMRSVWLLHEALKSQFLQAKPVEGELVAVLYRGRRKAKNPIPGRSETYHDYRVVVDRGESEEAETTWEAIEASTDDVQSDEVPF